MKLDRCVAPLVHVLNRLPELETTGSCQGHLDGKLPYVSFVCGQQFLWPILRAVNILNVVEPPQVRSYVEILAYGEGRLDVVLRFHHLFLKVKPTRRTVREWHRRIYRMTELIFAEIATGALSKAEGRRAFARDHSVGPSR